MNNISDFIEHIRNKLLTNANELQFSVISVAIFGSYTTGTYTTDSDIDMLIVANGINSTFHRRIKEIVTLKNFFAINIPLDIILITKEECIDNFKNHNPLFLDIAYSGTVIIDTESFLQSLIAETKEYITTHNLQKLGDGWQFPVSYRQATLLSSISNKDFAKAMLSDGKRDFEIGSTLINTNYYDKAIYHFQQSVEKCIKAILISFGQFKKSQVVGKLLTQILLLIDIYKDWKAKLQHIANISKKIEPQVALSPYPLVVNGNIWIPYEHYSKEDAIEIQNKAKVVVAVAFDFIMYWFIE